MTSAKASYQLAKTLLERYPMASIKNGDKLIGDLQNALNHTQPLSIVIDDESLLGFDHYARMAQRRARPYDPPEDSESERLVAYFKQLAKQLDTQGTSPCIQWIINTEERWCYTMYINADTQQVVLCDRQPSSARASELVD